MPEAPWWLRHAVRESLMITSIGAQARAQQEAEQEQGDPDDPTKGRSFFEGDRAIAHRQIIDRMRGHRAGRGV